MRLLEFWVHSTQPTEHLFAGIKTHLERLLGAPSLEYDGTDGIGAGDLTLEGLVDGDRVHPLVQNFVHCDAMQCGFCTPGMVMSAAALLAENPRPTEAEVRKYLEGNICRCTGYHNIVKAILAASKEMARGSKGKARKAA